MLEQLDGQVNFLDYFTRHTLDIKPKSLVDFINGMGVAQYSQIQDVIIKSIEYNELDVEGEAIGRITNSVSVWLLNIGIEYKNYLDKLIKEQCL